jgi:hypothetical protein
VSPNMFNGFFNCKTTLDGSQPNALQQATVKITNRARCKRAWESAVSILNQHICAGADKDVCQVSSEFIFFFFFFCKCRRSNSDANCYRPLDLHHYIYPCTSVLFFKGDSGGPLVVQAVAGSNAWTLVGITSFGNSMYIV